MSSEKISAFVLEGGSFLFHYSELLYASWGFYFFNPNPVGAGGRGAGNFTLPCWFNLNESRDFAAFINFSFGIPNLPSFQILGKNISGVDIFILQIYG